MSLFDEALNERFTTLPEIAAINVTSADTLLIHDSATGTVMRMPVSILYAALGSAFASLIDGKVPASQLPSYVDDVLEYANLAAFPAIGETGKIYVALDTNKTYRWSGSTYVYITSGAVDSVAGKTGVVTLVQADISGLKTNDTATFKTLVLNSSSFNGISFNYNGLQRWILARDDAESSGNSGSNLHLYRYNDDGSYLSTVLTINRATGTIRIFDIPTYADNTTAVAGGLATGVIYKTSTGDLRIVV